MWDSFIQVKFFYTVYTRSHTLTDTNNPKPGIKIFYFYFNKNKKQKCYKKSFDLQELYFFIIEQGVQWEKLLLSSYT